jgi:hypothetical protein
MNRRCTIVIAIATLVATALAAGPGIGPAAAQTDADRPVRQALPNDFGIELLGRSLLYSFTYQYMVSPYIGLEAGFSALGGGSISDDEGSTLLFGSGGGRLYMIPKDGSPFVTAGGVLASVSTDAGPFGDDESTGSYGYVGLGFEFRSRGGMLFRGTAYGLIAEGGFFIWPGLTVGYAF